MDSKFQAANIIGLVINSHGKKFWDRPITHWLFIFCVQICSCPTKIPGMSTFFANGHPLGPCSYRGPVLPLDLAAARPQGLHPGLGARYAAVDGARARVVRRLDLGGRERGRNLIQSRFRLAAHEHHASDLPVISPSSRAPCTCSPSPPCPGTTPSGSSYSGR